LSHTSLAHSLLPAQLEIWTFVPPSSDIQLPSGEAAKAAFDKRKSPAADKTRDFISTSIRLTHAPKYETQAKRG
jgi:hypothetical protein